MFIKKCIYIYTHLLVIRLIERTKTMQEQFRIFALNGTVHKAFLADCKTSWIRRFCSEMVTCQVSEENLDELNIPAAAR